MNDTHTTGTRVTAGGVEYPKRPTRAQLLALARRRAKNRVAGRSRRINRKRGAR